MPFIQPEVFEAPSWSDNWRPVRRIGNRPVVDLLDSDFAKGRNPRHRRHDIGFEPFKRVGEQFIFGVRGRSVDIAGRCPDLIRPEQQPARFLPQVIGGIGLAQHAHFGQPKALALHDRRMLFGDDILMFDRDHRDIEPNHRPGLAGKIAGAGNDMLAGNVALIGGHQPFAIRLLADPGHHRVPVNRRPALPRPLGQRLGQIGRLDIAIVRMLDRPQHTVGVAQRPDRLDLIRGEEIHVDANRPRDTGIIMIFVHPVGGRRQPDVGHLREADIQPGFCRQCGIQPDRILVQLADRVAEVEQWQQPGGMPGRPRGQFLPLDQHHVGPAEFGQMIKRADADHAAADHHRPCRTFHAGLPAWSILAVSLCQVSSASGNRKGHHPHLYSIF